MVRRAGIGISVINLSKIISKKRIDAEYFHPEKTQIQNRLEKFSGKSVGEYFDTIRELYTPESSDDELVFNFDLTDALSPFLDESTPKVVAGEIGSLKKRLANGDVVISRLRSYLKEIAIVDVASKNKILGSSEFIVFRPKANVNSDLLISFLQSSSVQTILKWSQDGSNHPRFKEDELLNIKLPSVIIQKQKNITDLTQKAVRKHRESFQFYADAENLLASELGLDKLDLSESLFNVRNVSDVMKSKRLDAEHFRQKYYRVIKVMEKLKPKSISTLGELTETLTNGHTPLHHDLDTGDIPFFTAEHVYDFRLDHDNSRRILKEHHETELKRTQLRNNDVLITIKGRVGNAAVVYDLPTTTNINQDVALLRLKPGIHPWYIAGFLNSPAGKALMEQIATGQINPFLGLSNLAQVKVPIFEEKRMNEIGEKIRKTVEKAEAASQETKHLLAEAKSEVERLIEGG